MPLFIKKSLIFTLVIIFSYLIAIFIISNFDEGFWYYIRKYTNVPAGIGKQGDSSLLRFREVKCYRDIDILFIGSSHCYRGFDTRIFKNNGLSTFNMGSTSQTPLNSYFLLKTYLDKLNPKAIVFDVYFTSFEGDGTESFIDLFLNTKNSNNLIMMAISTKNIVAINALLFIAFNQKIKSADKILPSLSSLDKYISGGFVETSKKEIISNESHAKFKIKVNSLQIKYLEKIIEYLNNNNIQIVLTSAPVSPEFFNAAINYQDWKDIIINISNRYKVEFIDFNDAKEFKQKSFFFDKDHLNQYGATKLSELLYLELLKFGIIEKNEPLK